MLPKFAAAGWPAPEASVVAPLTWKPVPGVENTAPRGELALKKLAARLLGAEEFEGTPSQLISRRCPPNDPLAPATVPPPRSKRNWSRAGMMAAALAPADDRTNCAWS